MFCWSLDDMDRPALPPDLPRRLDALLRSAWDHEPRLRPTAQELCSLLHSISVEGLPREDWIDESHADEQFSLLAVQGYNQ